MHTLEKLEELLPLLGNYNIDLATKLFRPYRERLALDIEQRQQDLQRSGTWDAEIEKASRDLYLWQQKSGKEQAYTAQSLAEARLVRNLANTYEDVYSFDLGRANTDHQASVREDMKRTKFRERLISEGDGNKKLGLVELSARLLPALDFSNSSIYFEGGFIPYGRNFRVVVGESVPKSNQPFVSATVAQESAANLQERFGVHYVLAETSAAPRRDVPKSGKKPEIYICGLAGEKQYAEPYVIDTPFRDEFNAVARELMYGMLKTMYGVAG